MVKQHDHTQGQPGLNRGDDQQKQRVGLTVQMLVQSGERNRCHDDALKHQLGGKKDDDQVAARQKADQTEGEQDRPENDVFRYAGHQNGSTSFPICPSGRGAGR